MAIPFILEVLVHIINLCLYTDAVLFFLTIAFLHQRVHYWIHILSAGKTPALIIQTVESNLVLLAFTYRKLFFKNYLKQRTRQHTN